MTLEVRGRKKFGKFTSMWKLNSTLINNQYVKEEIKREIRKYFQWCESRTHEKLWQVASAINFPFKKAENNVNL